MIVLLHVIIAMSSVAFTTFSYIKPSTAKLRGVYGLVGLTLASGLYLVWSAPAHMLQSCTVGFVYVCVVSVGIVATRRKLVALETSHNA